MITRVDLVENMNICAYEWFIVLTKVMKKRLVQNITDSLKQSIYSVAASVDTCKTKSELTLCSTVKRKPCIVLQCRIPYMAL